MKNNNFDYTIGISSSGISSLTTDISQCLSKIEDSTFEDIELPGNWVENSDLPNLLENSFLNVTSVTNLIESSVAASIADYNDTIRNGFTEKVCLLINRLENIQAYKFTINTGIETVFSDHSKILNRSTLLQKIAPHLYRKNIQMNIPVRLPSASERPKGKFVTFLRDTMCGNIKLAINIHPHEAIKQSTPVEILEEFRYFLDTVTFVYEPETGNMLVEKVITPWLDALKGLNFCGPVIFRPRVSSLDNLAVSLKNLSKMIQSKES